MKIQTGKGQIPLIALFAIWSVSAVVSLPGLAISPILGDLDKIFPKVSDLEIQMLASIPSLLIIPFVLLSGKLSVGKDKIRMLRGGMTLFFLCGVLYFFANSMMQLILISSLLGIGAGLIIPLSTGLVVDYFNGKYRIKQLGISSSINNLTLVGATMLTGYLANINWHLPFVVYLLPIVSLGLSWWLTPARGAAPMMLATPDPSEPKSIDTTKLRRLMVFYFAITFAVLAIPFYLPFLAQTHHISSGMSGVMISVFFLAIMTPGLFLNRIVDYLGRNINFWSLAMMAVGLVLIFVFNSHRSAMIVGSLLAGLGYGILQPLIYERTATAAPRNRATLALAFVMSVNYLAIMVCPFIVSALLRLLDVGAHDNHTPFLINGLLMGGLCAWEWWRGCRGHSEL